MAYNNGYPMNYQSMYPQYQQPFQQPNPTPSNLIWVQGEAGAKSYLVGPNQTVQLWDSESQTIYLKSADASGMPSMKILDYTIRNMATPNVTQGAAQNAANNTEERKEDIYVTKDEFRALEDKIQKKLDKLTIRNRKEAEDE